MTPRALTLAPLAALVLIFYGPGHIPFGWTHTLTETCAWHERLPLGPLDAMEPNPKEHSRQVVCFMGRGLASPTPLVKTILRKFPSPAQVAEWRNEYAQSDRPLDAPDHARPLPILRRR